MPPPVCSKNDPHRVVVRRWTQTLADLFFPPQCVHCRGLVEWPDENEGVEDASMTGHGSFRFLCRSCAAQIAWVRPPHCSACGHPFYGLVEGERQCPHCEGLQPAYREGRTAVLFKGPVRSLVIELKYHRGLHVLRDAAEIFRRAEHVLDLVRGGVLVPVPLHPRKERERGYNQTKLLADVLAAVAGQGTSVAPILRRMVDTPTQTAFDRRTRLANLKNAFALARGATLNPSFHYILIDDVFTTGSTLNSCAQALVRAGGLNVDVVTLGHG